MADSFRPGVDINGQLQAGIAMLQQGRMQEAWGHFAAVLQADPNHFLAHHLIGLVFLQSGQMEEGIASLKRSIALNPRDPAVHSNLGNALRDTGLHDEALAHYGHAVALAPDFPDAYNNRGVLLRAMERNAEALADYDRALALGPNISHVHSNRGGALAALGRGDEALAAHDRAVALAPGSADAHFNRANLLAELRRFPEAVDSFDRCLAIRPDYAEAWINRGNILFDLDRGMEALASYDRAIAIQSDIAQAHSNRSAALRALNRHAEAVESSDKALALDPEHAEALTNRGNALLAMDRGEEALESYDRAIEMRANLAQAYSNRGNALRMLGKHAEALESCQKAMALDPTVADPFFNRATVLQEMGLYDEALYEFGKCLALDPASPEALMNSGIAYLTTGDLGKGWGLYEARWNLKESLKVVEARGFAQPQWTGKETLAGKTILLHSEQGLGDTLQFCRYADLCKALGATVILEVEKPLMVIVATLKGADLVLEKYSPLPPFDYHCPILSLPLAFVTTVESIPGDVPYLHADPADVASWAARLGPKTKLRVGLVWSGGHRPEQPELWSVNRRRNIALARLAVLNNPGVEFHSLQKGQPAEGELALVLADWDGPPIADHAADLNDFTDTAALIENLDLVIAVDTSTAHLAGALAKPVWILNRFDTCWRWMLERTDTPWYPTARLFRQTGFDDWEPVLAELKAALDVAAAAGRAEPS